MLLRPSFATLVALRTFKFSPNVGGGPLYATWRPVHRRSNSFLKASVIRRDLSIKSRSTVSSTVRERLGAIRKSLVDIDQSVDWVTIQSEIDELRHCLEVRTRHSSSIVLNATNIKIDMATQDERIWANSTTKDLSHQTRLAHLQKQISTHKALQEQVSDVGDLAGVSGLFVGNLVTNMDCRAR